MKRLLAASLFAAVATLAPAAHASGLPQPGGTCDEPVDVGCRQPCYDELDCGLIPPCGVWIAGACRL